VRSGDRRHRRASSFEAMTVPIVSVVVPIFNVEPFLEECLISIGIQSHAELEVVLVEDGSTDNSVVIAERFVDEDERFVLHRYENAGLGAARNRGAAVATGDYLMFVDSDDVLPVDALAVMVKSLESTASDFATGRVVRFDSHAVWRSPLTGQSFDSFRPATHITERPDLVYDTTAWNKLFRRSFWDDHGFAFPEGVVYEDIALMASCHLSAAHVDVIPEVVYRWRSRDFGRPSITQDRFSVGALRDRLEALRQARCIVVERGDEELIRSFDKKVIHLDESSEKMLHDVVERGGLSARGFTKVLRVALTAADVLGDDEVRAEHIAEGVHARSFEGPVAPPAMRGRGGDGGG